MQPKHFMLAILAGFLASLAAPQTQAEMKVAVVDVARALLNSDAGQAGLEEIKEEFEDEEEELKAAQEETEELLERLKKDTELMSDQEFNQLLEDIQIKNSQLVTRGQNFQRVLTERRNRLVTSLRPKLQQAIERVVLAEDLDIVIPRDAAVYVGDLYDVTLKVTEQMNKLD